VRAVLAAVAVLERDRLGSGGEPGDLGQRRLAIVGEDEIEERLGLQLLQRVAQRALEGGAQTPEVPVEARNTEHLEREREELIQIFIAAAGWIGVLAGIHGLHPTL